MIRRKIQGGLFCLLVLMLASCKKKEPENHIFINQENLAHFLFKKGSYWIYKDSMTKNRDSIRIISNDRSTVVDNLGYTVDFERMELNGGTDSLFSRISLASNQVVFLFPLFSNPVSFTNPDPDDKVNNLTVNGVVYQTAIKVVDLNLEAYFVENVGLVKMYVKSDSTTVVKTLELDHYYIVK